MKLYTEEQVREMLKSTHIHTDNDVDMILPKFTPIELPTDEEIEIQSYFFITKESFVNGAEWVIEQIKKQINEN